MGHWIEGIHKAVARSGNVIVFGAVLFGEGNVKHSPKIVNVKRCETSGNSSIGKAADRRSGTREFINGAAIEIGGKNGVLCSRDREPFIHDAGYAGELFGTRSEHASPPVDATGLGCEKKRVAVEGAGSVEHLSGNRI